jgi:hypothetical protein
MIVCSSMLLVVAPRECFVVAPPVVRQWWLHAVTSRLFFHSSVIKKIVYLGRLGLHGYVPPHPTWTVFLVYNRFAAI